MIAMNTDEIIAYIRECLENGNYDSDSEHLDYHAFAEGFNIDDAIQVVVENDPVDEYVDRSRWFFCGTVPLLREYAQFRSRWMHVFIQFEEGARVELVTAYRPLVDEWETEKRPR